MNKKLTILWIALIPFFLQAQTLVEKVEKKAGSIDIPYTEYVYPNGLKLIVIEDHSDPIVHVNVTYHVGSARELPGKSGFAHFFEHMMFQGSLNVNDEEHFKIVQGAGGNMNGTTNRDRTNYFETVPKNYLETALWLEADRMGFLLDSVTKRKFEVQRKTVKNEKDQRYNRPYGFLNEVRDAALYPQGHPYSWSVIGYVDDLDRANVGDLKNFFLRWYGPNNATLVVAGDVKPSDVAAKVKKYFGSINKCPEVRKQYTQKFYIPEDKVIAKVDDVYYSMLHVTYPTPPAMHKDEAPLDILTALMGRGKSSILYKEFEKPEFAIQSNVSNGTSELAGELAFMLILYPDVPILDMQKKLKKTINGFDKTWFTKEDFDRIKIGFASQYDGFGEGVASKARMIQLYRLYGSKTIRNLQSDKDRYANVTMADVKRVYNKYIKNKPALYVQITKDPAIIGGNRDDREIYKSVNPNAEYKDLAREKQYIGLRYKRPIDNFDRSKKPEIGAYEKPKKVVYNQGKFANGLKTIYTKTTETPMVTLSINIDGGHMLEGTKKIPYGTAALMTTMMTEGTQNYTAEEWSKEMQGFRGNIWSNAGNTGFSIGMTCHKDDIDKGVKYLEEFMMSPNFSPESFKRTKKIVMNSLASQRKNNGAVAGRVFQRLMYGDNPLGIPAVGTSESMDKVSLNAVISLYNQNLSPKVSRLTVVGNIDEADVMSKLGFLKEWKAKEVKITYPTEMPKWNNTQIFIVDKEFSKQSQVFIGKKSLAFDAYGDFLKLRFANFSMGGSFNSRLNLNLREDKGWTYGIRSGVRSGVKDLPGLFLVSAGIKGNKTDSAISEIMTVMNNYSVNGITNEELEFTKKSLILSEALKYETSGAKAGLLRYVVSRGLDDDFTSKQQGIIEGMDVNSVNKIAKQHLNPNDMIILVVGDSREIKKQLEALGYGKVQTLDSEGEGKKKVYKIKFDTNR